MAKDKEFNEQEEQESNRLSDEQPENLAENAKDTKVEDEKKELTPEEKYSELNDRFLRLYAEFENFRRRTNKEKVDMITNASEGILKDLLPVLDDFERAIANNENLEDIGTVKEGFHLIFNKFRHVLDSKGLKPMIAKGEAFDSELHEAIANVPAPSNGDKGKVIDDVEKGYFLHDKVIRFAKVVVGQ